MKCEKSNEVVAFLKGEIPEPERSSLRAHLDACADCAREAEEARRVLDAFSRMERIEPSPGFPARVREAFLQAHPGFAARPRRPEPAFARPAFSSVPAWALSLAAHVVLAALAAILIFIPKSPEEELEDNAVQAKPKEFTGRAPEFSRGRAAKDAPSGEVRDFVPVGPEIEDFASGADLPSRGTVRAPAMHSDPRIEKLDLTKWSERIPRDRRFLAFFDGRGTESQKEVLRAAYAGQGTERAVRSALEWLAREQKPNGRWTEPPLRPGEAESAFTPALTGLALLAFLAEGNTPRAGDFAAVVRKGIDYLMAEQRASGLIGPEGSNTMYNHAIASLALLEAAMMTRDEALSTSASAAVSATIAAQNKTGGWGYTSRAPENDTSVGGWQILLLRLAKLNGNAGVIPALVQANHRLRLMTDSEGKVGYRSPGQYPNGARALTAVGMLAHQMSTPLPDPDLLEKQADVLLETGSGINPRPQANMSNDLYLGYFGSLAMHQYGGGGKYEQWFVPLRDSLLKAQLRDGSWPPDLDRWCQYGRQVYTTAAAALILETAIRYPRLNE